MKPKKDKKEYNKPLPSSHLVCVNGYYRQTSNGKVIEVLPYVRRSPYYGKPK